MIGLILCRFALFLQFKSHAKPQSVKHFTDILALVI